jgi:hypothetical protein
MGHVPRAVQVLVPTPAILGQGVGKSAPPSLLIRADLLRIDHFWSLALAGVAEERSIARVGRPIPGRYIVVLDSPAGPDVEQKARGLAAAHGGVVELIYRHGLKGYSAAMNEQQARAIANQPGVVLVQEDNILSATLTRIVPDGAWGIDRIDQHDLPLDQANATIPTGITARVFVVDSGVRSTHQQLTGRVPPLGSCFYGVNDGYHCEDCTGHGTHVAGIIGGLTTGVARGVQIERVRVLDCDGEGPTSVILAGLDYINEVTAADGKNGVVNMSLGSAPGTRDMALEAGVRASIDLGLTYVIAAGNSSALACNSSPSAVTEAIVVGATTIDDAFAGFSNHGSCVDILAPGDAIFSSYIQNDDTYAVLSGTSMAAPHVAGVAALYLQVKPDATPAEVAQSILSRATPNRISGVPPNTPNLLLYSGCDNPMSITQIVPAVPAFCPGDDVTLSFSATAGDPPVLYQWYRKASVGDWTEVVDGGRISGATTATLTIQDVAPSDAFAYMARAFNACLQSLATDEVQLIVSPLPHVTVTGDAFVCPNEIVTITATITGGVAPFKLVWSDGTVQTGIAAAGPGEPVIATRQVSAEATTSWSVTEIYGSTGQASLNESCAGTSVGSAALTVRQPSISSFTPAAGPVDSGVVISGTGFLGATGVRFNGVAATAFSGDSATQVTALVPQGATSGPLTIVTTGCTSLPSTNPFTVTALAAPVTMTATATGTTSVSVTWSAVAGASSYEIIRTTNGTTVVVGTSPGTAYTDTSCVAATSYVYRVRAMGPAGLGAPSEPDLATTVLFTDNLLSAIRAVHWTELRTAVNAVRTAAGMESFPFTNPSLAGAPVRAVHLTELRSALTAARAALTLPTIAYSDPMVTAGSTVVRAVHLQELRTAVR